MDLLERVVTLSAGSLLWIASMFFFVVLRFADHVTPNSRRSLNFMCDLVCRLWVCLAPRRLRFRFIDYATVHVKLLNCSVFELDFVFFGLPVLELEFLKV